jgi:hypothetical protein
MSIIEVFTLFFNALFMVLRLVTFLEIIYRAVKVYAQTFADLWQDVYSMR